MRLREWTMVMCCATAFVGCVTDETTEASQDDSTHVAERRAQSSDNAIALEEQATEVGAGGCYLYTGANYTGSSTYIPQGMDYNDLHRILGFGDVVSSIYCEGLDNPTVWVNSNFSGSSLYVSSNMATLGSFDNAISSISWSTGGLPGYCTFFSDSNWGGSTLTISAGRDYNDLHRASPAFGDTISSVSCSSNITTLPRVCTNDTWGGSCLQLTGTGSYANLGSIGYGDNISSVAWF